MFPNQDSEQLKSPFLRLVGPGKNKSSKTGTPIGTNIWKRSTTGQTVAEHPEQVQCVACKQWFPQSQTKAKYRFSKPRCRECYQRFVSDDHDDHDPF